MENSTIQEIFACPFFWGDLNDKEAEDILTNEPLGSYILRKSWNRDYLLRISFKDSNIRHGHICKLDTSDQVYSKHYVNLEDVLKDKIQSSFCGIKKTLKFPVKRKNTFSLQKLTRACIADSTRLQVETKLKLPKKLQDYVKEYQSTRLSEAIMLSFTCDDFFPDLPDEGLLFHSEMDERIWLRKRIQSEHNEMINMIAETRALIIEMRKMRNSIGEITICIKEIE